MTLEMWLVLGILITAIVLFVTELLRVDIVALGVVVVLMVSGVLTTAEALSGFSNSAVLTIAALFIVGGAVLQTGLAGMIGRRILAVAGTNERWLTVVLMGAVALLSSFMSDTGTVAVLLPAVIILTRSADIAPSKLLIPLAFGSLLGGAMTLIGTPPNIIVSDLLRENGLRPFQFFSYTPIGFILVVVGILFMLFIGRRILPNRKAVVEGQRMTTPKELVEMYRLPDNLFRLRVRRGSGLVGQTLAYSKLRQDFAVTVLKIMRSAEPRPAAISLVGRGEVGNGRDAKAEPIIPSIDTIIELDDVLIVQGEGDDVAHAAAHWNLGVQPPKPKDEKALLSREVGVAEVLLPPRSDLVGKTLVDSKFGSRYKLTVLGLNRPQTSHKLDLKSTVLQFGDTLLVQGAWTDILALKQQRRDFIVMGQPESMIGAPNQGKARIALVVLLGMLVLMIGDFLPLAAASMLAALAMILTGCLTMDEAYQSINWPSIVLVAGMLPMSVALEKVGLVDAAASGIIGVIGGLGPIAVLAGLFLLTSIFTQVLSNTATTVIVAPIALAAAQTLGIQPYAFLMAVAIAASMAFATPVASPVNTLVMGAGDYRFGDYIKVGVPMILLTLVVSVLLLPLLFPFS
ncbi:MAG: SLC13 family permease [Ardenticatenaceae bacterium]|nr:SLC13 family permease [Ardenticatenaceae bacterium]